MGDPVRASMAERSEEVNDWLAVVPNLHQTEWRSIGHASRIEQFRLYDARSIWRRRWESGSKKSRGKFGSNLQSCSDSNHQRSHWEFLLQSQQSRAESRKLEYERYPRAGPADLWNVRQGLRIRTWLVKPGLSAREENGALRRESE